MAVSLCSQRAFGIAIMEDSWLCKSRDVGIGDLRGEPHAYALASICLPNADSSTGGFLVTGFGDNHIQIRRARPASCHDALERTQ